jgi:hypothetical protein
MSQLGGVSPNGKITFTLMTEGGRFIRYRGHSHDSRGSIGHIDACMVLRRA